MCGGADSKLIDGIFMALFRNDLMKIATFSRGFWTVNMTIKGGPLFSTSPKISMNDDQSGHQFRFKGKKEIEFANGKNRWAQ